MSGNEEGGGEYKDGPKDTIEVRGPENLINRYKLDLLQLYFESQKDLNGSITDISFDAANAVVVIKFDSEQAAKRIIGCPSHVLKGESLKIKLRQNPNFRARSAQTTHAGSIVRVSGLKRIEAKEIVEYYFENKRRSGGGPITSFVPVESDDDTYEITFENTKDATSVVQRPHIINGLSVDVALLHNDRETEYYKDRFLIKGLPKNTSDEYLLCFIKAVTGMKPKFLAFHKKEKDVVLVIMRCDLDVAQFIEHCKEETLEGVKIQIYEVEVSNVIHVSNLPGNIHSDTILLYFENKRKSKGGTVKNVNRLDTASCLVYFEDYKVIESVLSHAHVLQRRDIIVRKYFKCVAQTEEETFSTSIPPAVAIPDLDIRILKFIQQNEEFKHIVEQELLSHHAQIDWPKEGSDSCEVSINCIVDESKVLSNRVILRWEMEIREVFKLLMDKIYVHSITLIGEFNFDDSCVECTAGNEENTLVLLDRGECRITFLGTSPKLAATLCSQDNFSGDAEEELKVERVSLTHAVEFKMLRSLDYRDRIIKEVPNISMNENEENLGVDFEGYPLDVRNAKLLILEMKNEYNIVFLYSLSALSSKLYSNSLTVDYVNKSLTSAGLDCIWKVSQQTLIICCLKKYDLETCIRVIKASVIDDVIHQHTNEVDMCDMSLLETELHKLEAQYLGKVAISLEGDNEIYLCSTKDIRDVILKEIQEGMMKQSRCQVIEKYQLIRKQITSLKRIETRMLLADKFPTEMENLFPDLKVKINQNKNEICFEGPLGQVRDAEIRMYELKASFAVDRSWKISELAAGLLILKQTKEHVVKNLKASRVTAVWDTVDGCLEVYCTSQDQIQLCVNVIRASVIEHTVALRKAAKTVVNSDKWQTKVDELHLYHAGKCMIKVSADSCKVQICATNDIVNEILDIVEICLRQNTVVEAKVPCTRNVHRLIERHHKNEIFNIAKGLTNCNVQISSVPEYGGFEVRGTEDGLQQALQQLHQLLLKVKQKEHVMTKPGLSKHMQTPKGKDNLNTIESMHQCVVAVKGDYDEDEITDNPYDTVPKGKAQPFSKDRPAQKKTVSMTKGEIARQKAFENETRRWSRGMEGRQYDMYQDLQGRFARKPSAGSGDEDEDNLYESLDNADGSKDDDGVYKFGSLKILVQQGDITAQNTQCIVNSSNEALDLSRGNVSQAILKKGGKSLEKEVNDKRKKMKKEDLVITSAPGMSCQKIMHVVAKETAQEWQDIIEKCLFKAEKEHMKDIAFPVLGTGIQIDASVIATAMAKAILNFAKTDPKSLQDIRLVIFQKQMVGEFDKAISKASQPNEGWNGKLVRSVKDWFGGGEQDQSSRGQIKEKHAKNQDQNKVTFIILAMSENIIDQAISKLENCLDKEISSSNFNDSIIKNMNHQEIMEIKSVATRHHLDIKVEASKGIIQISGNSANVSKAADNIHRIMRHAVIVEQERKTAELMINLVQWRYIEYEDTGLTLKPYDKVQNYKIESAYLSKTDFVKFRDDKINYILDFLKMEVFPEDDPNDSVIVIRRDVVKQGAFEAPALWADMTGNLRSVVLQPTSPEYTDIAQKFTTSAGDTFTVVKIERIQNKALWAQYQAKKKQLEDENPPNTTNERLLWHGTAAEAVDYINGYGFNRSYCGKNATYYGDGVYFAVNANYSCSNTYSLPDPSGVKRVYYCRVLTGEYTQGTEGMRLPPEKGGYGGTAIYDSVVENQASPGMFVIFHDTQAYPEYLISFK